MATQWLRRGWLLAACASVLALAACGGGETESSFDPERIVVFGDAFADAGQNGARYTVNDGTANNWTLRVAADFDKPLAPSATGGLSYAVGNARVTAKPDAAGDATTPTVEEQIDAFLAAETPDGNDLVIVNAGTSDLIVQGQAALTNASTQDQALDAAGQAGRDLGAQVRRLVDAGARHVLVVGPYNLGRSIWAQQVTGGESLLEELTTRFNAQMLVSIADLGNSVLYVDAAFLFNLVTSQPQQYNMENEAHETLVCTSVDPGNGIGTGAGQANSNQCTPATIAAGLDYNRYLFADRVYMTPRGHELLGDHAVDRLRDRW